VARLGALRAPTLFVVGEQDRATLRLNLQASEKLSCPYRLVMIPRAGHRFREPGTLRAAATQLRAWFQTSSEENGGPSADAAESPGQFTVGESGAAAP
jgi:putative phosphoribosyl transferase